MLSFAAASEEAAISETSFNAVLNSSYEVGSTRVDLTTNQVRSASSRSTCPTDYLRGLIIAAEPKCRNDPEL